jgi:hypothetical protein
VYSTTTADAALDSPTAAIYLAMVEAIHHGSGSKSKFFYLLFQLLKYYIKTKDYFYRYTVHLEQIYYYNILLFYQKFMKATIKLAFSWLKSVDANLKSQPK